MNYVQMDLKEMEAPKLKGDVYVHQCELEAVFNGNAMGVQSDLKSFNEKHETTKFVCNRCFRQNGESRNQFKFHYRLVQLGDETPFLYEVIAFLSNLGMELLNVSCRSYLATDIPTTILPEQEGINEFLNEIFCLEKCDEYCGSMSFDLFETAQRHQPLLNQLGLKAKMFKTVAFNASGRYQYLQLTEANGSRHHNFKASFWEKEEDGMVFYAESHRIETTQLEEELENQRRAAFEFLKDLGGYHSFDDVILPL